MGGGGHPGNADKALQERDPQLSLAMNPGDGDELQEFRVRFSAQRCCTSSWVSEPF
jgi:hypothetical protein